MSIWNKVLVGLILIATLGFTYQATVYLKISELCREEVQKQEAELAKVENENHVLREADDEAVRPGIRRNEIRLHKLLSNRGRVWYHCEPRQQRQARPARDREDRPEPDDLTVADSLPQGGPEIAVAIAAPDPHGIALNAVLYAFEETPAKAKAEESGRFVGEFVVTSVDDDNNQVVLTPTTTLSQKEAAALAKSPAKGLWTLYDTMPLDGHDTFAKMDDEEKKAGLPKSTVNEYIRDGEPAEPDDPKELTVDGKYVRRLRDYEVLFREFKNRCGTLIDQIAVVTRDNVYLDAALTDAGEQVAFRKQEKAELTVDRDGYRRDVSAQTSHQKVVQAKLASIQKSITRIIAKNHALAAEISRIQLAARDRIDAKTRRLADTTARPK